MNAPIVRNSSVVINTSNALACPRVMIGYKRTQIIITNTSAAAVATIAKGATVAVAGSGIRLPPNGSYLESSDSGFSCWQDEVQVIADAAGTIAVVEQLERI
jgi:hypothetical protein